MSSYQLDTGLYSLTGRKEENQDSTGIRFPEDDELTHKGITIAITDGVSGCDDGKAASEFCIKSLMTDYYATSDSWSVKKSVEQVLLATNRWLYAQGSEHNPAAKSMASTLSAIIVKSTTAHITHIGDTRVYRLRAGKLEQLTNDHSWSNGKEQYLLRAMGIDLGLQLDYQTTNVEADDVFILTTDGVHEYIPQQFLADSIHNSETLDKAAQAIVDAAYQNDSPDNLTCMIVRFKQLPSPTADEIYQQLADLPFPPDLQAGAILDGIHIIRTLHTSSRCQVYLAELPESGTRVIVKTPSVNYQDDAGYLELFRHEEWVGNRVKNPHVMQSIKIDGHKKTFLYHIAEYIEGETLQQWITDNPQPDKQQVREIADQIARGLAAFHRMEMLHQDLKPDNIMLDKSGTIKLIDFGSVKIAGIEEISTPIQRIDLLGTRHYSAPEYFLGYAGTQRSDQFSMAVIIYEMLTGGALPYGEKYGEGSFTRYNYVSMRTINPDIPVWMDRTLEKALSIDPAKRYQELSEFLFDLSKPNPKFIRQDRQPLLERNPLAFWKGVAIASVLANIGLLIWQNSALGN